MIDVDSINLKAEEVESLVKLYMKNKDSYDYLIRFGSAIDRVKFGLIKAVATQGKHI